MLPEQENFLSFRSASRGSTLDEALRRWARARPQGIAVSQGPAALTYGALRAVVEELEGRLAGLGLEPGDRVALLGDNTVDWVVAFLAVLGRGAVVVPLNNRLSIAELGRQIEVSEPRALLAADRFVERANSVVPNAERVWSLERDVARSVFRLPLEEMERVLPRADEAAAISFTSGTTGAPKGATITHGGLVASASAYAARFDTSSADSTLALVPLFHNTGFVDQLTQMLLVGGSLDLLGGFSVRGALDALARRPASYLIAVPSIYRLLMLSERADEAFRGCRLAAYGGSTMPRSWIEELARRWPHMRLYNVYGLTEFTSVSHILGPEHLPDRAESVGPPVEGVHHRVVDDRGIEAPRGAVGEIELAGPMRMAGYWRDQRATRAAFADGWLRTGDLGSIGDDGFLTVQGRAADVINRGGEKIHAAHVESVLSRAQSVAEAAVVGAPHPVFQERVVACVVVKPGNEFDEDAILLHLGQEVPDYAVPDRFVILDALPHNAAGKIDRHALREIAAEADEADAP